jgi:hypothetical protein
MRRVRVLCGAVVVCAALELMGQAAPVSPKLGETEPSLMMPEGASFDIGADGNFLVDGRPRFLIGNLYYGGFGHDMKATDYLDTGHLNYQVPPGWWVDNN